jgi:hypothetical protein
MIFLIAFIICFPQTFFGDRHSGCMENITARVLYNFYRVHWKVFRMMTNPWHHRFNPLFQPTNSQGPNTAKLKLFKILHCLVYLPFGYFWTVKFFTMRHTYRCCFYHVFKLTDATTVALMGIPSVNNTQRFFRKRNHELELKFIGNQNRD